MRSVTGVGPGASKFTLTGRDHCASMPRRRSRCAQACLTWSARSNRPGRPRMRLNIIGRSANARRRLRSTGPCSKSTIAPSALSVLIQGETGTGKELLARFVHAASGRKGAFVAVNCAALSRELLEAELFGIEAGVATGVSAREGRFFQADGGTLLLDEITEMPDDCQAKLLRVLQEREVVPVGARHARAIDVRILAATNREISARSGQNGPLRPDLIHRLAGWKVRLPPLRERAEDIPQLAGHFLARAARDAGRQPAGISHAAMDALCAHDWPGNVRELEQEMQRAALFVEHRELLGSRHLSPEIANLEKVTADLQDVSAEAQRQAIEQALAKHDGNATHAARALGISRATLYRRMKDLKVRR